MGRGRQKAKQTKVARELKYHTSSIDVNALQRELTGGTQYPSNPRSWTKTRRRGSVLVVLQVRGRGRRRPSSGVRQPAPITFGSSR